MPDIQALGERAFTHVYELAANIGPRPAGSPAELAAFAYIAGQLRGWGYRPEVTPAPFAPAPRFSPMYVSGGAALALGGVLLPAAPWLALLPAVWIAALPDLAREMIRRRPRPAQSQNLLAFTAASAAAPTLILCAHVDSAPASALRSRPLVWLQQNLMFGALRVAWALAAVAALGRLGLALPEPILTLAAGAAILVGGAWAVIEALDQLLRGARYSPGAHDNASGVGVLLAVAEHLAGQPPVRERVGFLFTGAEETGMHGAEALAPQWIGRRLAVLNVDMVGAGERLHYVTGDGALRVRGTDERLNDLIRAACPEARGLAYTLRSGDCLPFLRQGVPAGSLQTGGSAEAELAYHTVYDTVDVVEVEALGRSAQVVVGVIAAADARGYPEAA
jgi:hypothetical protein